MHTIKFYIKCNFNKKTKILMLWIPKIIKLKINNKISKIQLIIIKILTIKSKKNIILHGMI